MGFRVIRPAVQHDFLSADSVADAERSVNGRKFDVTGKYLGEIVGYSESHCTGKVKSPASYRGENMHAKRARPLP
jgi:hypothetical protein